MAAQALALSIAFVIQLPNANANWRKTRLTFSMTPLKSG
jgi:hypothetical protein